MDDDTSTAARGIVAMHARVDVAAQRLENRHADRLLCRRGCSACCVDDITVFSVEAVRIRVEFPDVLASTPPHATGACAFLDDWGACRIYTARPYVCRTQGLPLRWIDEQADGEWVEYRDICELNEAGVPLEELPEQDCWSLGEIEGELAELERQEASKLRRPMLRVALRTLFIQPAREPKCA